MTQIPAALTATAVAIDRAPAALTTTGGIIWRCQCHWEYSRRRHLSGTLMRYSLLAAAKAALAQSVVQAPATGRPVPRAGASPAVPVVHSHEGNRHAPDRSGDISRSGGDSGRSDTTAHSSPSASLADEHLINSESGATLTLLCEGTVGVAPSSIVWCTTPIGLLSKASILGSP